MCFPNESFSYLWIKQGGHEEKVFMPLCEGGMSLNGSTSSTQTPVNIQSSACCNKEGKRAGTGGLCWSAPQANTDHYRQPQDDLC